VQHTEAASFLILILLSSANAAAHACVNLDAATAATSLVAVILAVNEIRPPTDCASACGLTLDCLVGVAAAIIIAVYGIAPAFRCMRAMMRTR
jgi:hypothetical protein